MLPVIQQHQEALIALCWTFGVRRLVLFGSAAAGAFQPGTSNLDFLAEFETSSHHGIWRADTSDCWNRWRPFWVSGESGSRLGG